MFRFQKLGYLVLLASLVLASCASPQNPPLQNPTSTGPGQPAPTDLPASPVPATPAPVPTGVSSQGDYLASKVQRALSPQAPESDQKALAAGNEAFAADLYQQLRQQDGNLFFSPYSISLALAMAYGGARGETEKQMADTLHFTLPQAQLHPAFNSLDQALESLNQSGSSGSAQPTAAPGEPQGLQLNIANSIWGQKGFNFSQDYLDLLALNYGAGLRLADFTNAPDPSRQEINQWVSDQTKGKIQDLFPQGSITTDTRLALANAIYFKASWDKPFQEQATQNGSFHLADGSQVDTPMMKSGETASFFEQGQGFQAVGLPYYGGDTMMVIVLPDEGKFDQVESGMDAAKLNEVLTGLQGGKVDLTMPKFTFSSEFGLADTLKAMGMTDAFDPSSADLSGIDGKKDLLISGVFHKAFVAVDEKGTEAAAATGISVGVTAVTESHTVIVDRPFLFYIYDQPTGTILFAGRVMNPSAQ